MMNCTQALDEKNLKEVFEAALKLKSKYYAFGRSLGLCPSDLDAISSDNPRNSEKALNDVLLLWLRQNFNVQKFGVPSWKKLIEAVGDPAGGQNPSLAKVIASEHPDCEHCELGSNEQYCNSQSYVFDPVGRTIDRHIDEIIDNVENPIKLAERLCSAELIPQTVLEDVRDSNVYKPYQGMAILFKSSIARQRISSNPDLFEKFLKILLEVMPAGIEEVVMNIRKTFMLESRQCKLQHQKTALQVDCHHPRAYCRRARVPSVHISKCVAYLKVYYQRHVRPLKFPHKAPAKYINLALIRREGLTRSQSSNIVSSTIHGNIDDILDATSKSPFTIEQVAQPNEDGSLPNLILVVGAPGVGKSTFAQKLALDWSKGNLLQAYTMVLLLKARNMDVQKATKLSHIMYPKDLQDVAAKELNETFGDGILFIIDGYDELSPDKRCFLDSLICGELLPAATVMVTTRSSAKDHILRHCLLNSVSQLIEILGFTKENIESYAESEMGNNHEMLTSFRSYLACYPHIHSAMYIPLNCTFVVQIYIENWNEEDIVVPKTMTDLYTSLIRSHLLRHTLSKGSGISSLITIESLPDYDKFFLLCKFAHDNLLNNKVVFSQDDLPLGFETFSLMQEEVELYVDKGYTKSYNFNHFTVQEYLSAFFVSKQSSEDQLHFLHSHKNTKRLNVVMKFFSGLTKLQKLDIVCLQEVIAPGDEEVQTVSTDSLHMLFEVHNGETIQKILYGKTITFKHISFPSLTPYDYHVLGYCISCTSVAWDIFVWSEVSDESLRLFTIGAETESNFAIRRNGGVTHLLMQGCNFGSIRLDSLLKCYLLTHLVSLTLQETNLDENACAVLSECAMLFPYLEHLNLGRNPMLFLGGGARQLFDSLLINNSIKVLLFENTGLKEGCAVANFLTICKSLSVLDVDDNFLDFEDTKLILEALQVNKNIKYIGLSTSNLSGYNCSLVGCILRYNYIQKLYINNCQINSEGVEYIAKALIENQSLFLLHLSNNQIGETGALSLAQMIAKNTMLKKLTVGDETMGEHGASYLIECLVCNSTLEILELPNVYESLAKEITQTFDARIKWIKS